MKFMVNVDWEGVSCAYGLGYDKVYLSFKSILNRLVKAFSFLVLVADIPSSVYTFTNSH